jgi:hypothetical protein
LKYFLEHFDLFYTIMQPGSQRLGVVGRDVVAAKLCFPDKLAEPWRFLIKRAARHRRWAASAV